MGPLKHARHPAHPFDFSISRRQGHETCALLILEKINDRNLINCTNSALQTYVFSLGLFNLKFFCPVLTAHPPCRPLHVAARKGLTVVVQELLGKGASVLAVDENGRSPSSCCSLLLTVHVMKYGVFF